MPAYHAGKLAVYVNGVLQPASGYTATNGTSVVMTLAANDEVSIVNHGAASGGAVTSYANKTAIDAVSSPSEGDLAYDLAADQLYIRTTSSWMTGYLLVPLRSRRRTTSGRLRRRKDIAVRLRRRRGLGRDRGRRTRPRRGVLLAAT